MSSIIGTWDLEMRTPIGSLGAVYVFTDTDGVLTGSATSTSETVPLETITWDGTRATWRQSVTRPMRLNLDFDVTVNGHALTGHSRAGRLPQTAVSGIRRSTSEGTV